MSLRYIYIIFSLLLTVSCSEHKEKAMTPWGTPVGGDTAVVTGSFTLDDIVSNGEMIMLTLTGPDNYYDYRGRGMGTQYLLCEKFAQQLGVSLRVEVCKDTAELVSRLQQGEGDVAAFPLPGNIRGVRLCGLSDNGRRWAVRDENKALADTLDRWYRPDMLARIKKEEAFLLSSRSITRHVYSPMLNRSAGVISQYDAYFQKYAPLARWDWRLMAAQCYQESTFDPNARSWVGACGLMQIMPGTADHLGLPRAQMYHPEANIAAAANYIRELDTKLRDVPDRMERTYFVLACYNGGFNHIRDAMALARKHGRNPHRWGEVAPFVLRLSTPECYNDPVVKYGYMRGSETVDYVERIRSRYAQYRGVATGGFSTHFGTPAVPQKARRKYRFHI
jgi:membrane-bound lytic murein transglycosylase F